MKIIIITDNHDEDFTLLTCVEIEAEVNSEMTHGHHESSKYYSYERLKYQKLYSSLVCSLNYFLAPHQFTSFFFAPDHNKHVPIKNVENFLDNNRFNSYQKKTLPYFALVRWNYLVRS